MQDSSGQALSAPTKPHATPNEKQEQAEAQGEPNWDEPSTVLHCYDYANKIYKLSVNETKLL